MFDSVLLGLGRHTIPIPGFLWRRLIKFQAGKVAASLRFMSEDHHRVRDFVVLELVQVDAPICPERIAEELSLDLDRVNSILDKLEKRLTFLFRNEQGAVTWAYPVTVDPTPHRAHFSTGEDAFSP